jgi:GNAT superfamily N-acetyltransferase
MISIRKAKPNDYEKSIELLKDENLRGTDGDYYKLKWLYDLKDDLFFVAEKEKIVIGVIFGEHVNTDGAIIWMLAVSKAFRNHGVGSLLLREFEKACKQRNRPWIIAYAIDDDSTLQFYKKNHYALGKKCVEVEKFL